MRYLLFCLVAVVSVLILWTPPAVAELVTVQVTGHVTASDFDTIGVGSPLTGFYSYDDSTTNSYHDDSLGVYHPVTFSLTFVDGSSISSNEAEISVNNNSMGGGTTDEYSVKFPQNMYPDPSPNTLTGSFEGFDVEFGALIYLYDTEGNAWDSVALPDPELVLSLLPSQDSSLSLAIPESLWSGKNLDFMVTDLSVVPTPGAALLGILGLISASWRLRKRRTA